MLQNEYDCDMNLSAIKNVILWVFPLYPELFVFAHPAALFSS
jgi:hypothetical protein